MISHGKLRTLVASAAIVGIGVAVIAAGPISAVAAPASASDALDAAVSGLQGQGYNLNGTAGSTASGGHGQLTATGSVDPTTKSASLEFKGTEQGTPVDLAFTETDGALYAKIAIPPVQSQLGVDPNQWIKVDTAKVTSAQAVPFDLSGKTDALDVNGLLTSVSDVQYPNPSDPTTITGTVDLTASTGVGAPDPQDLATAGTAAATTPFTATLDSQGRLIGLKINADSYDGDLTEDINYSDFGSPTPVTAPTSSIPAPDSAYIFFSN